MELLQFGDKSSTLMWKWYKFHDVKWICNCLEFLASIAYAKIEKVSPRTYKLLLFAGTLFVNHVNTLRSRKNGHCFADDVFKCIFLNENIWTLMKISLKFVLKDPINNIPGLVQAMAWRRSGAKPLSEPMMVRLPTHIVGLNELNLPLMRDHRTF